MRRLLLLAISNYDFAASLDGIGDIAASKKAIQDGLALSRELGDKEIIAIGPHNAADYLFVQGDLAGAQQGYEQSVALNKERKSLVAAAESQSALAGVLLELNQPGRNLLAVPPPNCND